MQERKRWARPLKVFRISSGIRGRADDDDDQEKKKGRRGEGADWVADIRRRLANGVVNRHSHQRYGLWL